MKKPTMATIWSEPSSGGYMHAKIAVLRPEKRSWRPELFVIQWQTDSEKAPGVWYGTRVIAEGGAADFAAVAAFLKAHPPEGEGPVTWFAKSGLTRAIHDPRFHADVPIDKLAPEHYRRFLSREGDGRFAVAVVCAREDAERELTREWAREVAINPSLAARFARWVEQGRQIYEDPHGVPPAVQPVDVVFQGFTKP